MARTTEEIINQAIRENHRWELLASAVPRTPMHILIAEEDTALGSFLANVLTAERYSCQLAGTGEEALARLEAETFDLLILDVQFPTDVIRRIRAWNSELSILILTATAPVADCLNAGADDYLCKPFSLVELFARVRAPLRPKVGRLQTILRADDLELDCVLRTVRRSGKEIELAPLEFSLLEYFMRNAGRQLTHNMIIENVWKLPLGTSSNVVDVYVHYLREKIDSNHDVKLIRTVQGAGYEFGPETSKAREGT